MAKFYVNRNAQDDGYHEVHDSSCSYMPDPENQLYLGEFSTCYGAVVAARQHYTLVDGCYYCCYACHTR